MSVDRERAQQIMAETDYWQAVLDDLLSLNTTGEQIVGDIGNATVSLLSLISLTDARANEFVRDGMQACNDAMGRLLEFQSQLMSALRIVEGRARALRAEVDVT